MPRTVPSTPLNTFRTDCSTVSALLRGGETLLVYPKPLECPIKINFPMFMSWLVKFCSEHSTSSASNISLFRYLLPQCEKALTVCTLKHPVRSRIKLKLKTKIFRLILEKWLFSRYPDNVWVISENVPVWSQTNCCIWVTCFKPSLYWQPLLLFLYLIWMYWVSHL